MRPAPWTQGFHRPFDVARRAAALPPDIGWGATGLRLPILFNRWPCGERRASASLASLASLSNFVEPCRILSNHPSRLLSKFVERFSLFSHFKHAIMKSTGNYSFRRSTPVPTLRFSFLPSSFTLLMEFR